MLNQDLTNLKPGDMLKEADLGSYIGAMGLGVAEAQKALDDNSMAQLIELSQPVAALKGKSLIQLGLLPAFYHFRKATLTASVSMSLKVSESLSVGGTLTVNSDGKFDKTVTKSSNAKHVIAKKIIVTDSNDSAFEITNLASETASAIKRIDGYSQVLQSGHTVVSSRADLSESTDFGAMSLVRWNSDNATFMVPPAGHGWQVWMFKAASTASESFVVKNTDVWSSPANQSFQGLAEWLASEANSSANNLWAFAFDRNNLRVHFDFGKDKISHGDEPKLRILADFLKTAGLSGVQLTGRTDPVGATAANQQLGLDRAEAVRKFLVGNGVPEGVFQTPILSEGESAAESDETNSDLIRAPDRHVQIDLGTSGVWFVFISGVDVKDDGEAVLVSSSSNGLVAKGKYAENGTINLSSEPESVISAADIASKFNGHTKFTASHEVGSEIVYLSNKVGTDSDVYELEIWNQNGSKMTIKSISANSESGEDVLTTDEAENLTKTKNRTTAFALSIDARYAKSYDLSMSGNMSVSAELVSVPPPQEFIEFIKKTWEE